MFSLKQQPHGAPDPSVVGGISLFVGAILIWHTAILSGSRSGLNATRDAFATFMVRTLLTRLGLSSG